MKRNLLTRFVAILLVPCLLVDPVLAASACTAALSPVYTFMSVAGPGVHVSTVFTEQALAMRAVTVRLNGTPTIGLDQAASRARTEQSNSRSPVLAMAMVIIQACSALLGGQKSHSVQDTSVSPSSGYTLLDRGQPMSGSLYKLLLPFLEDTYREISEASKAEGKQIPFAEVHYQKVCEIVAYRLAGKLGAAGWKITVQRYSGIRVDPHYVLFLEYAGRLWLLDPTWQQFLNSDQREGSLPKALLLEESDIGRPEVYAALGLAPLWPPVWQTLLHDYRSGQKQPTLNEPIKPAAIIEPPSPSSISAQELAAPLSKARRERDLQTLRKWVNQYWQIWNKIQLKCLTLRMPLPSNENDINIGQTVYSPELVSLLHQWEQMKSPIRWMMMELHNHGGMSREDMKKEVRDLPDTLMTRDEWTTTSSPASVQRVDNHFNKKDHEAHAKTLRRVFWASIISAVGIMGVGLSQGIHYQALGFVAAALIPLIAAWVSHLHEGIAIDDIWILGDHLVAITPLGRSRSTRWRRATDEQQSPDLSANEVLKHLFGSDPQDSPEFRQRVLALARVAHEELRHQRGQEEFRAKWGAVRDTNEWRFDAISNGVDAKTLLNELKQLIDTTLPRPPGSAYASEGARSTTALSSDPEAPSSESPESDVRPRRLNPVGQIVALLDELGDVSDLPLSGAMLEVLRHIRAGERDMAQIARALERKVTRQLVEAIARALLQALENEKEYRKRTVEGVPWEARPLIDLRLNRATQEMLRTTNNIDRVGQLMAMTKDEAQALPGIGPKRIRYIEARLLRETGQRFRLTSPIEAAKPPDAPAGSQNYTIATTPEYQREGPRPIELDLAHIAQMETTRERLRRDHGALLGDVLDAVKITLVQGLDAMAHFVIGQIVQDLLAHNHPVADLITTYHEMLHAKLRQERHRRPDREERLAEEVAVTYKELEYFFNLPPAEQDDYLRYLEEHRRDIDGRLYRELIDSLRPAVWGKDRFPILWKIAGYVDPKKPINLTRAEDMVDQLSMDRWPSVPADNLVRKRWDWLTASSPPQDEGKAVEQFHELTKAGTWTELTDHQLRSLKGFYEAARNDYPVLAQMYLSEKALNDAFSDPAGVLDFVRRVHPYTWQALRAQENGAFTVRAVLHESAYYWLYALKLRGKLPQGGLPVINVDPHADVKTKHDPDVGELLVNGITDFNWAAAAVRDGLASHVLSVRFYIVATAYGHVFSRDGRVFHEFLGFDATNYPWIRDQESLLTIDLDTFSLIENEIGSRSHYPLLVLAYARLPLIEMLIKLSIRPLGLVTAISPNYLAPEAHTEPGYIEKALEVIEKTVESLYDRGHGHRKPAVQASRQELEAA